MLSPEILYLKELVESGQTDKALGVGRDLLLRSNFSAAELAHINRLVACARFKGGDTIGAVPPATLAMKLATDLGLWDLHGTLCVELGQYYLNLRDPERARHFLSEYLMHQAKYHEALRLEPRIWANLGVTWAMEENHRQAVAAFRRAKAGFLEREEWRQALLLWPHLFSSARIASPDDLASLFRDMRRFAKQWKDKPDVVATYLLELGRNAFKKGRLWRAVTLGLRARELSSSQVGLRFQVHMFLAEAARQLGYLQDALGYALTARVIALQGQCYDLEFEAVELMHQLVQSGGRDLVVSLDRDYLAQGIDISRYVSRSFLSPRRTQRAERSIGRNETLTS